MSQMSQVKRAMITAVCIALCVVLPMAFHSIQNAGAIFCPMHIPLFSAYRYPGGRVTAAWRFHDRWCVPKQQQSAGTES